MRLDSAQTGGPPEWLIIVAIVIFLGLMIGCPGFRWFVLNIALNIALSSGRSSGGGSSSGGGGGFSGGGGSSGGGGASGSW
ncbi:MAG: hypothetical protein WDN48_13085 [Pseudolabrys sp.]